MRRAGRGTFGEGGKVGITADASCVDEGEKAGQRNPDSIDCGEGRGESKSKKWEVSVQVMRREK